MRLYFQFNQPKVPSRSCKVLIISRLRVKAPSHTFTPSCHQKVWRHMKTPSHGTSSLAIGYVTVKAWRHLLTLIRRKCSLNEGWNSTSPLHRLVSYWKTIRSVWSLASRNFTSLHVLNLNSWEALFILWLFVSKVIFRFSCRLRRDFIGNKLE